MNQVKNDSKYPRTFWTYCIPRKDFARFKSALFAVGMIPRIFIAANMSLITNPRTFLASPKYNINVQNIYYNLLTQKKIKTGAIEMVKELFMYVIDTCLHAEKENINY
jgi:hypothetical protein